MIAYAFAWILPLFAGAALWCAVGGVPRKPGELAAAIGAGWLCGVMLAGAAARLTATADTRHAFAIAAPWIVLMGVLGWTTVALRWRRDRVLRNAGFACRSRDETPVDSTRLVAGWTRWLWWVLLAMITIRLYGLASEALLRPIFPWDAWTAWVIKAKTWFLLGHAEPYVSAADWSAHPQQALRTLASWNYPELLAWIELWFVSAAGDWLEPLIGVVWSGVCAAFVLAAYGQWRVVGVDSRVAMALCYALVSLPLLNVHVALAGYADLWIMAVLGLAAVTWLRYMVCGERGQWWIALGLALCLPAIKLEGSVWMLCFVAVLALQRLLPPWRLRVCVSVTVAFVLCAFLGVLMFPLPHLGWVRFSGSAIEVTMLGTVHLHWHDVGGAMVRGLFALPNWHLLWYLLPVLVVWRRDVLWRDPGARFAGLLLLVCVAFPAILFLFTDAAAWAADYTSANRLFLQIVGVVFALAAALLREPFDLLDVQTINADGATHIRDTPTSTPTPTGRG